MRQHLPCGNSADDKSLLDCAQERSSSIYLTLVGILEPLVLGYFLYELRAEWLFGADASLVYWLETMIIAETAIMVWYEFAMSSLCIVWVLDYLDFLFPFVLVVAQFAMIRLANHGNHCSFFFSLATLSSVCLLSLLCQAGKLRRSRMFSVRSLDSVDTRAVGSCCLRRCMPELTVAILPGCILVSLMFGTLLLATHLVRTWAHVAMLSAASVALLCIGIARFKKWGKFLQSISLESTNNDAPTE